MRQLFFALVLLLLAVGNTPIQRVVYIVLDSGVDPYHYVFRGYTIHRYVVQNLKSEGLEDFTGHGTHVASILLSGQSPEKVTLLSIKVINKLGLVPEILDVVVGLEKVTELLHLYIDSVVILVLPFTLRPLHHKPLSVRSGTVIEHQLQSLHNQGVAHIYAAAGNFADNACNYIPGRMDIVTTISSKDYDKANYGPCVNEYASGVNICGAHPENTFKSRNGTSMATALFARDIGVSYTGQAKWDLIRLCTP